MNRKICSFWAYGGVYAQNIVPHLLWKEYHISSRQLASVKDQKWHKHELGKMLIQMANKYMYFTWREILLELDNIII